MIDDLVARYEFLGLPHGSLLVFIKSYMNTCTLLRYPEKKRMHGWVIPYHSVIGHCERDSILTNITTRRRACQPRYPYILWVGDPFFTSELILSRVCHQLNLQCIFPSKCGSHSVLFLYFSTKEFKPRI